MSKRNSPYIKFLDNLSENTIKSYRIAIRKYERFHGLTIDELILEALDEQEERVPMHRLSIISRLEDFQQSLIDANLVLGTIKEYMAKIKSVYHKNRIDIPYIEPVNPKKANKRPTIEYKDVLTKDELKQILPHMRLPIRARAMAMIQGGLSNEECEHLTTYQFIEETRKYHQCSDDVDALQWLATHPILWVTRMTRIKTGKPYYAVIGAEAVNCIAEAKLYEKDIKSNNGEIPAKLFNSHKISINRVCVKINKRLHLGKVGGENKLKPHNLRRFHATHIRGSALSYQDEANISLAEIDELQGRGKTSVQDTYIKSNPLEQKLIYAKVMNNLSLYNEYEYSVVDGDVIINVKNQMVENQKLVKKVEKLESQMQEKRKASEKVQKLREELGEDTFNELIGEILNVS